MNAWTELPIGIVEGMPNETYQTLPALGSGGLRKLARSPRHFFGTMLDPLRPTVEPSPAMRAGTLAHTCVLEPHAMAERYIVRPAGLDLRTKDGKAWAASVPPGIEGITAEQMLTAQRQATAIRALPEVAALLESGWAERSAFWIDEATGERCKCRPDWVSPTGDGDAVILLDVKTCLSASPKDFARSVVQWSYASQAAWYSLGYELASGKKVLGFVFAATESDYPHAACSFMLDDEWLARAHRKNRRLLSLYSECRKSDTWPSYAGTIQLLEAPRWLPEDDA